MIDRAAISAARQRLASQPHFCAARRCCVCPAPPWGGLCRGLAEAEHLQVGGSFKARGMLYRLLANPVPDSGVIIASGGNAGIAVAAAAQAWACAARCLCPRCRPSQARPPARIGAEVVVTGAAYAQALRRAWPASKPLAPCRPTPMTSPRCWQGAGTLALELEEQGGRPPDTVLLVSVGGGGLIGGVAAWVESRAHVVALEPERAPTLHAARRRASRWMWMSVASRPIPLGAKRIGAIAWQVSQRHVHDACCCPMTPSAPPSYGCGAS